MGLKSPTFFDKGFLGTGVTVPIFQLQGIIDVVNDSFMIWLSSK